jgi:hypothetical protein
MDHCINSIDDCYAGINVFIVMHNFICLKRDKKPVKYTYFTPKYPKIPYVPLKHPYFTLKCEKGPRGNPK